MKSFKVSFIMGVYNCESSLSSCIESIISQTFTDWELIICDDGSMDRSYEIAQKYADKFENITVLKNDKNMRLPATLNRCLEVSNGEYIARIDADDLCLPDRLKKQVDFLDNNPEYDLVGGWALLYDENGDKGLRKKEENPDKFSMRKGSPFIHPTIMMKRSKFMDLKGYTVSKRTIKGQDTDLWFRFFSKGYRAYNLQVPLIKYHESIDDYKKYNLKSSVLRVQNHYTGFKLLGFPKVYYLYLIKPIISSLVPRKIRHWYTSRNIY